MHQLRAVRVVGAAENERHALDPLQPMHQHVELLRLARVGDRVDHERDQAGAAAVQRSRHGVRPIAVLLRQRQDPLAGCAADAAPGVKARETVAEDTPASLARSIEVRRLRFMRPQVLCFYARLFSMLIAIPSLAADALIASHRRANRRPLDTVEGFGMRPLAHGLKGVHRRIGDLRHLSYRGLFADRHLTPCPPGVDPHDGLGVKETDRRSTSGRTVARGVECHQRPVGLGARRQRRSRRLCGPDCW